MKKLDRNAAQWGGWMRAAAITAIGAALYALAAYGVPALLGWGYGALMVGWGVTTRSIAYAARWVHQLNAAMPTVATVLQSAVMAGGALGLTRWAMGGAGEPRAGHSGRKAAVGALVGGLLAAGCVALLLLTGSSRLGWRLTQPKVTVESALLLISIAAYAIGEECLFRGYLMGALIHGGRRTAAYFVSVGLYALADGLQTPQPMSIVNGALMGLVCGLMYERSGGIALGLGFRLGWLLIIRWMAGMPLLSGALYEVYPASCEWLSGGAAGLMNGLIAAVALGALAAWLGWKSMRGGKGDAAR